MLLIRNNRNLQHLIAFLGTSGSCYFSYSESASTTPPSRRQGSDLAGFIQKNLGPHFPLIVVGGGGVLIGGALLLSLFTSRRGERAISVIEAAERALGKAPDIRASMIRGPINASGSYQIGADSTTASGHFDASLTEKVRARVVLEASRTSPSHEWVFSHLRVEIDRKGLSARNAFRREQAVARYGAEKLGAAESEVRGNVNLDNDDVIVFVVEGKEEILASQKLQ